MPSLRVGRWVRHVIVDEFANRVELVLSILTQLHGPPGGRLGAFRFDAKNMRDASAAKVDADRLKALRARVSRNKRTWWFFDQER